MVSNNKFKTRLTHMYDGIMSQPLALCECKIFHQGKLPKTFIGQEATSLSGLGEDGACAISHFSDENPYSKTVIKSRSHWRVARS